MANNEFNKEAIIKWIAQRIKDEQRKHEKHQDRWHEIAARKIYATYDITLKPVIETVNECDYCGNLYCQGSCEQYH